jgi:hypothetical protein
VKTEAALQLKGQLLYSLLQNRGKLLLALSFHHLREKKLMPTPNERHIVIKYYRETVPASVWSQALLVFSKHLQRERTEPDLQFPKGVS